MIFLLLSLLGLECWILGFLSFRLFFSFKILWSLFIFFLMLIFFSLFILQFFLITLLLYLFLSLSGIWYIFAFVFFFSLQPYLCTDCLLCFMAFVTLHLLLYLRYCFLKIFLSCKAFHGALLIYPLSVSITLAIEPFLLIFVASSQKMYELFDIMLGNNLTLSILILSVIKICISLQSIRLNLRPQMWAQSNSWHHLHFFDLICIFIFLPFLRKHPISSLAQPIFFWQRRRDKLCYGSTVDLLGEVEFECGIEGSFVRCSRFKHPWSLGFGMTCLTFLTSRGHR